MKKAVRKTLDDDMRAEYDFSDGVRGKHYQAMQAGYTVKIHRADGSTIVKHYKPADGTIVLAPDVRKYFPNSDAVNHTLRSLITLLPNKRRAAVRKAQNASPGRQLNTKSG